MLNVIIMKMWPLHWILTKFNPHYQALFSQNRFYIISSLFYTVALENEREFHTKLMYIPVISMTTEEVNIISKSSTVFLTLGGEDVGRRGLSVVQRSVI